jgi:hypothetical protein
MSGRMKNREGLCRDGDHAVLSMRAPRKPDKFQAASHDALPSIALPARQNQAWLGPALAGTSNNFSGSVDLNQRDLTVRDHFLRPAWGLT